MATRLGLRSSDVRDLKFSNINWDTNEICLVQYKTKQTIALPLLRDVGEAIIAYIKMADHNHQVSVCLYHTTSLMIGFKWSIFTKWLRNIFVKQR